MAPYRPGTEGLDQASVAMRLASTAAMFAEKLRGHPDLADAAYRDLLTFMHGVAEAWNPDPRPGQLTWMIRTADAIAGN